MRIAERVVSALAVIAILRGCFTILPMAALAAFLLYIAAKLVP